MTKLLSRTAAVSIILWCMALFALIHSTLLRAQYDNPIIQKAFSYAILLSFTLYIVGVQHMLICNMRKKIEKIKTYFEENTNPPIDQSE